ncbi:hypothetical protein B0T22DRAFT_467728 [Podospora appendiculata]|uniref:Secreted protein n=1 Tax=Podospora appendiculata TaxID=314037 RepID=A0AAE0X252_9PEZI|nr:hypothetical protein B0T22DRAFT_467728 [Podospora appendiculata]
MYRRCIAVKYLNTSCLHRRLLACLVLACCHPHHRAQTYMSQVYPIYELRQIYICPSLLPLLLRHVCLIYTKPRKITERRRQPAL